MVSRRLLSVPASPIRRLVPYATAAKNKGVTVHHLNIGDPDVLTPQIMLDELKNWDRNPIGYENSQGNQELIKAMKSYYHGLGFKFIRDDNLQITMGGSEAIAMAMFAVTNPGDEILVFEPFYANYNTYAAYSEIKLKPVRCDIKTGFHLPPAKEIERQINAKTKAILICSPNNPTGTVYNKKEIEMLIRIVRKHHLFLLSDEVYREFVYDKVKQISLLNYIRSMPDSIILLDSLSKRYSLCGARIGVLVSLNREIMDGVLRLAQGRLSAGLVDQVMASRLTRVSKKYYEKVNREYDKRRNVLYSGLLTIPGITVSKPEGAFYVIAGLPVKNAEDFCIWLLTDFRDQNETVMLAPASGFYATPGLGANEVRIAYVLCVPKIKRAVEIIRKALEKYQTRHSERK